MIRRDLTSAVHQPTWLLISQMEHARLSGALADHCKLPDAEGVLRDEDDTNDVPREVLAAITHHDDGWLGWEREPEIDLQEGRPLSYMGEVALEKVLAIWRESIHSARRHGPLAGWMVARHFLYLLEGSESNANEAARAWREEMEANCTAWFDEWQAADPRHSVGTSSRAVSFLQFFDLLSLWLCCDCPIGGFDYAQSFKPLDLRSPRGDLGPYRFMPLARVAKVVMSRERSETAVRSIHVEPYPFDIDSLEIGAMGLVVPKMPDRPWGEMAAESSERTLAWRFVARPMGG